MEEKRYIKRKEKALVDGNREQLAVSCNHLGDYYNQQGKYHNAVKEYEQEAEIYNRLGKQLEMAKAQRMVGEMFMLLSEFDNAKEHINLYLKSVKRLQNKVEEQRAYATLGRAHLLHGQSLSEVSAGTAVQQLKMAEKSFLKSLLLIKELSGQISKLEQLDMQARCYLNIGVVKEHIEEYDESIAYIDKAIKISKSNDIFELTHLCYISMSLLYHCKINNPTLALRFCNLAQEVAKRLPNKVKKICETLITKSEILIKEGDFASAKQILTKAYKKNTPDENDRNAIEKSLRVVVKICQALDELVTTSCTDYEKRRTIYEKLGDGCCHLQNYAKALEYYQQMLACAESNAATGKQLIPIYVSLYQTYKDNKQYDIALEYLWKEHELNKEEPTEAFSTLCTIADIYELQMQSFWTVQDIYMKAKEQASKATGVSKQKLLKIVFVRLRKLQLKNKMNTLVEMLDDEIKSNGIDLSTLEEESDAESDHASIEQNTPELGADVCLDELTDSDTSDLDETEKPRAHRVTRGTRSLTVKRNNKGETQLHQACIAGNLELVRRLIDQGHVVNVRDHAGWLPLHEACNHGFRDIVELLLDRGASSAINDKGGTSCDGITPLYDACTNGYLDVIELLLERGADATLKTDFGDTCLNALDKWRRTTTLVEGEQAQYEQLRGGILKRLSKVGICSLENNAALTNSQAVSDENSSASKSCGDDDEYDATTTWSQNNSPAVLKEKNSTRSTSASADYRQVMDQLKRSHRTNTMHDEHYLASGSSSSGKQKRTALLNADDVEVDSWLIDDVGPEKKKRKMQTPTKERAAATTSGTISLSGTTAKSTSSDDLSRLELSSSHLDFLTPEMDAFEILLDARTSTNAEKRQKQASKLRLPRSSSMNSNSSLQQNIGSRGSGSAKPKYQASLLDSGFCRFRSESPMSSEESTDACSMARFRAAEADSTTTSIQLLISPGKSSPIKVQATQLVSATVSFKIKVEDELLLVPVERKKLNDINIRWLAEEAARRYYNTVGLKPVLRLKTSDGFAYEENDAVNVALEETMILGAVTEWKMSPLPQRYEEMCRQCNKEINGVVLTALEKAQLSNVIDFNDCWLTSQLTEPIFKSILHQQLLHTLDLSNNFIQNEGCRQLAKSLHTLKQLKTLKLQGNLITCEGLELLCTATGVEKLTQLEELNLNQNPLGNSCIAILHKFCALKTTLQKLALSNCNITNFGDYDLNFFGLTTFDISFNHLQDVALRKVLEQLNSSRLQYLNVSYTISNAACAAHLAQFFEAGTCEQFKHVALAGCHLSDAHMERIVQCLHKSNDLHTLDISQNPNLSVAALKCLLTDVPQLKKLMATNCDRLLTTELQEQALAHLPHFMSVTISADIEHRLLAAWQAQWGSKAKHLRCARNFQLYLNDVDLNCFD